MASMGAPVRLTESQVMMAAIVLARAFMEDAGTVYMIPDPVERTRLLPPLFAPLIRLAIAHGEAHTTANAESIALWLPPDGSTPADADMAAAGIGDAIEQMGQEITGRMVNLSTHLETVHAAMMPEAHWRLSFLGVEPERQGQGVGGALIQPMLDRIAAAGETCYLETLEARTIPFYERHGFRVVNESDVPESAVHVWAMRTG